jgi:acyl-CoA hydrolase
VESYIERMSGERLLINCAYLTLVGVDADGKPQRLPRLILETEEDKAEWKAAEQRREIRKKEYGV